MKRRIYIAGKISYLPKKEAESLFNRADRLIVSLGNIARNPVKIVPAPPENMTDEEAVEFWIKAMEILLPELMRADAIYMLPNWQDSQGARIEHNLAFEMRKPIIYANSPSAPISNHWEKPIIKTTQV